MKEKKFFAVVAILFATVFQLLLWRPIYLWMVIVLPTFPYGPYLVITLLLTLSLPLSFLIKNRKVSSFFHFLGEALFNFVNVLAPMLIIADILSLIIDNFPVLKVGTTILILFLFICIVGVINAFFIREKHYSMKLDKPCEDLRIALISDIHLGIFSDRNMSQRIVRAVIKTRPDIVLIAGDFFDDRFEEIRNTESIVSDFKSLSDIIPVYCAEGNHDLFSPSPERTAFLKEAGIHWLEDEVMEFKGFQILFRKDASNQSRKTMQELAAGVRKDQPLIVVSHNPSDIKELWDVGADLTLSGHTHGGQTFPGSFIYKLLPILSYGIKTGEGKIAIVTSGIGFYGIPIRFLVNNEVVLVEISAT